MSQYQAPYVDGNTGEQVSAVNLLLLETNISVISGDKEGRLKVRTTGEGDGLLCRNGQSVPIHWSRADRNSPFAYTTRTASRWLWAGETATSASWTPKPAR